MPNEHPGDPRPELPEDVVTGFWLWLLALPLMVAGYVLDLSTAPDQGWLEVAFAGFSAVVLTAIVLALLMLLRQGYRWARTILSGGGIASVVYAVGDLFTVDRTGLAAPAYAACAIIGSVLIAGGVFLLHRRDAHGYFVR